MKYCFLCSFYIVTGLGDLTVVEWFSFEGLCFSEEQYMQFVKPYCFLNFQKVSGEHQTPLYGFPQIFFFLLGKFWASRV